MLERLGDERGRLAVRGERARASLSVMIVCTSRCCAASWRSRCRRRRVRRRSATTRAREAVSSARDSALAIAAATSSANCCRRDSVPPGSGCAGDVAVQHAPHPPGDDDRCRDGRREAELGGQLRVALAAVVIDAHRATVAPDPVRQRVRLERDGRAQRRGAAVRGDHHERVVLLEAGERHRLAAEQAGRLPGDGGEHLLRRHRERDELGDVTQGRLLVGQLASRPVPARWRSRWRRARRTAPGASRPSATAGSR